MISRFRRRENRLPAETLPIEPENAYELRKSGQVAKGFSGRSS
jgi:hypothetical protein